MSRRVCSGVTISVVWAFLALGCSVYQPNLVSERGGSSSAGTENASGEPGMGGGTGGSAGASTSGAGRGGGGGGGGMTGGAAGESSALAGADGEGDGGAPPCVGETFAEFCTRLGKDCDAVDGRDNCGNPVVGAHCGSCQGFRMCGGGGEENVCGALTDPAVGGIATASSVGSIAENGDKAFDLNVSTKWYNGSGASGWLVFQFPGTSAHIVQSYSVTSANDVPARDPTDWQLQGSNDGAGWVMVDQRSGQVFATRHLTSSYTCANTTAYRFYRLLVTANAGAGQLQLAEFVLYGI